MTTTDNLKANLRERARVLHLHGLLDHWQEAADWACDLIAWEEDARARRSLERRIKASRIGRFKPLCDFEWDWPTAVDRMAFENLMALDFIKDATNLVFVGGNGLGKSTLACNIAHEALIHGHTVLFVTAGEMLGELAALDSDALLRRRLRRYVAPAVLIIDEIGYLSYSNRHADLLFELISRRYETKSTIVTTNRAFRDWGEIFPNAACVVSMVDRLMHRAELISIEGESYRAKEAAERAAIKAKRREEEKP
jgi:DNA replication protein DnaC